MIEERLAVDLDRMLGAASNAVAFLNGISESAFAADRKTQAATSMCLIVLAEAASRIMKRYPQFVSAHAGWPWDEIRGLRNRIVHDYENLDFMVVWDTTTNSPPALITGIEALGPLDPRAHSGS